MRSIISIEGNIGVGKSTLLTQLKKRNYSIYNEPIEKWTLLDKFYKNQKKYVFNLQTQILMSYYDIYQNMPKTGFVFVERGPWACKNVFIQNSKKLGIWTSYYDLQFEKQFEKYGFLPNKIIYLELDSNECLNRIKKRSRNCEININFSYLESLNTAYKEALQNIDHYIINVENKTTQQIADQVELLLKQPQ